MAETNRVCGSAVESSQDSDNDADDELDDDNALETEMHADSMCNHNDDDVNNKDDVVSDETDEKLSILSDNAEPENNLTQDIEDSSIIFEENQLGGMYASDWYNDSVDSEYGLPSKWCESYITDTFDLSKNSAPQKQRKSCCKKHYRSMINEQLKRSRHTQTSDLSSGSEEYITASENESHVTSRVVPKCVNYPDDRLVSLDTVTVTESDSDFSELTDVLSDDSHIGSEEIPLSSYTSSKRKRLRKRRNVPLRQASAYTSANVNPNLGSIPKRTSKCLHADAVVQGIPLSFLVDTGAANTILSTAAYSRILDSCSNYTVVSKDVYNNLPKPPSLSPTKRRFVCGNGGIVPAIGICVLPVELNGHTFQMNCYVADIGGRNTAILGMDNLTRYMFDVSPASKKMYSSKHDCVVPLTHTSGTLTGVLRSKKRTAIKSNDYTIVPVNTVNWKKHLSYGAEYMSESHPYIWEKYGLYVYPGMVDPFSDTAQVVVYNPTEYDITLEPNTLVSYAHAVDSVVDLTNTEIVDEKLDELDEMLEMAEREMDSGYDSDDTPFSYFPVNSPEDSCSRDYEVAMERLPSYMKPMLRDAVKSLTILQFERLVTLLLRYKHVFVDKDLGGSVAKECVHLINTITKEPIKQAPRQISYKKKCIVEDEIQKMLQLKVISESDSPWSSPIVLVTKKDGTTRFCVDYRKLNKVTIKDAYPLPQIDDILNKLYGAKYFCTLDLASGYWQVAVAEKDREKTAFATHLGLFHFNVMPFGLTNAPATFQKYMDKILRGLVREICLVYLDDIIVFGKTYEECLRNLEKVFARLEKYNLKAKPKKCVLFKEEQNYLGFIVSGEGIKADPEKVRAMVNWEVPTRVADVRAFLGTANYYRRFIPDFGTVARPLNALLQKGKAFTWSVEAQKSFEILKKALVSSPVLALPDERLPYIVDTDASNYAIGAVLGQVQDGVEKVICYGSKALNGSQLNWCTTKRELYAVYYFVTNKWRAHLEYSTFKVRSDHSSLQWLKNFKGHDPMLARWLLALQPFEPFEIEYRKGKKHQNADGLSRKPSKRKCKKDSCHDCYGSKDDERMDARIDDLLGSIDETNPLEEFLCCPNVNCPDSILGKLQKRNPVSTLEPLMGIVDMMSVDKDDSGIFSELSDVDDERAQALPKTTLSADDQRKNLPKPDEVVNDDANQESVTPDFSEQEIIALQAEDPDISRFLKWKKDCEGSMTRKEMLKMDLPHGVRVLISMRDRLEVIGGVLYKVRDRSGKPCYRMIAPKSIRKDLLYFVHGAKHSGHWGVERCRRELSKRFYWPGMTKDIKNWVLKCLPCDMIKGVKGKTKLPLNLEIPSVKFEKVSFDVVTPGGITDRGNRYILVLIDHFSKFADAYALPDHTAETVANCIVNRWIKYFGCPRRLHCDHAREFEGIVLKQVTEYLEISKTRTTPFAPWSDGQCERMNQTLEKMLAAVCYDHKQDWDLYLDLCIATYNSTPSNTTGYSPHMILFGQEKVMPIDLVYGVGGKARERSQDLDVSSCYCAYVQSLQEKLRYVYSVAFDKLGTYCNRMKLYYDSGLKKRCFKPGEWVIRYYQPYKADVLGYPSRGPYVVEKQNSEHVYTIRESEHADSMTVHANHLRPCRAYRGKPNWITENKERIEVTAAGNSNVIPSKPTAVKCREVACQHSVAHRMKSTCVQTAPVMESVATQWNDSDLTLRRSERKKKPPDRFSTWL